MPRFYADASFVPHLLAIASDAPQTRLRRRASVDTASAAYGGTMPTVARAITQKTV